MNLFKDFGAIFCYGPFRAILLLAAVLLSVSGRATAGDCRNDWMHPYAQTMTTDSSTSFALADYQNKERHFSAENGLGQSLDIYYLKDIVLIKGYSEAQIEEMSRDVLAMMPVFSLGVPSLILSRAAPGGPCNIRAKTQFSIKLAGDNRLRDPSLSSSAGYFFRSAPNQIAYQLDVLIDPPVSGKTSVRYSGTMSFEPQEESPSGDVNVAGYTVFADSRPFPVIGSAAVPVVNLGEVRRFFESRRVAPR